MVYEIEIADLAENALKAVRPFDRRRIVDEIIQHLQHQPLVITRKCLVGVVPEFEHIPPVWELRIGDYRVFYDVNESAQIVYVRALRRKEHGQTTGEILHEKDNP